MQILRKNARALVAILPGTLLVLFLVSGCGGGGGNSNVTPPPPPPVGGNTAILRDTTRVLPADGSVKIERTDATHLKLSGAVPALKVGDVISSPSGGGIMVKVTGISKTGSATDVAVTPATLEDTFKTLDASVKVPLTQADLSKAALAPGVSISAGNKQSGSNQASQTDAQNLSIPLKVDFSKVIYDKDGNPATKGDQLKMNIAIKDVRLSPYLDMDFNFLTSKYKMESGVELESGDVEFSLSHETANDIELTRTLAGVEVKGEQSLLVKPIEVPADIVIPTPLVVPVIIPATLKADVLVGYTLKFDFNLKPTLKVTFKGKLGAGYDNGRVYSVTENHFKTDFNFGDSNLFDGSVNLVAPRVKVNWLIGGFAGPFGTFGFFDRATIKGTSVPPEFKVAAVVGLAPNFGAETRFISGPVKFPRYETNYEVVLGRKDFRFDLGGNLDATVK